MIIHTIMDSKNLFFTSPIAYECKVDESKFPLAKISQSFDDGSTVTEKFYCFSGNGDEATSCPEAFFVFEEEYVARSERLYWDNTDRFQNLDRVLQGSAKITWNDEIVNDNSIVSAPADQKYGLAIKKLITVFCGGDASGDDLHDTLFNSMLFAKRKSDDVFTYSNRMKRVFHLKQRLPHKTYPPQLTEQEKKLILFKHFPYPWKEHFNHSSLELSQISMTELINYMNKEKKAADYHEAQRTKNREQEFRKITGQKKSRKRKQHEQDTNDKDQNKSDENYNQCRKHPKHRHTWEECFLNPRNPNNKLKKQKKGKFNKNNNSTQNQTPENQPPAGEQRAADDGNSQSQTTPNVATLENIWG